MKLTMKQLAEKYGLNEKTVRSILKGIEKETNGKGLLVFDDRKFEQIRAKIPRGRPRRKHKPFNFDFDALKRKLKNKGVMMKDFFKLSGISRNRYYSITSESVCPTDTERKILRSAMSKLD